MRVEELLVLRGALRECPEPDELLEVEATDMAAEHRRCGLL
jgi:hypothetical protein